MKTFFILYLFLFGFTFAQTECPFGVENDPYPGQCWLYTDQNNNEICDLWENNISGSEAGSEEWESSHECDEEVGEWELAGSVLKTMTLQQVADYYKVDFLELQEKISKDLNQNIVWVSSVQALHDDYWLRMEKLKELVGEITIDKNTESNKNSFFVSVYDYLDSLRLVYFLFIFLFFLLAKLLYSKKQSWTTVFINFLCYIAVPLYIVEESVRIGYFGWTGWPVFDFGKEMWYWAIRLLFFILLVKPISVLFINSKNIVVKHINWISCFAMKRRKQFGILVFWLALSHFLVYFAFWLTKDVWLFSFFQKKAFVLWLISFIALFIGFITSNNFSIKLLHKNWKLVQKTAYIALFLAVLHIVILAPEKWYFFLLVLVKYWLLKLFEIKKISKKDSPTLSPK